MADSKKQGENLYNLFVALTYAFIIIELLVFIFYDHKNFSAIQPIIVRLKNIVIYRDGNIIYSRLFILFFLIITSIGSKPKKALEINLKTRIFIPITLGLLLFFGSIYFYSSDVHYQKNVMTLYEKIFVVLSFLGAVLLHTGCDTISKVIKLKFMDDKFNKENESFMHPTEKLVNDYSLNLPILFYYKKKIRKGWFNLTNPFRGTLLIGTPESGKTFSIINPFIRNWLEKKHTMVLYDYKYPKMSQMAYYYHCMNKRNDPNYNFEFHVVNLHDIEYSKRVNPLHPKYIKTLGHATETATSLVEAIKKNKSDTGGSEQFFTQSAINFLSACLYYLSKHEGGKYSTLAHLLSFLNRSYEEIFSLLFTNIELESLLSPFRTAFENKVWNQLEGQIGTLKINLSRLHTKESAWVFSGNDVELDISSHKNPGIIVIANNEETKTINSTTNSLLLNRLVKLVNRKDNKPCAIVVDEIPTIYFHDIEGLIGTARENKVAVILGLQELPQLEQYYGKQVSSTITSVIGNVISGQARKKETLEWLVTLFGKVKQIKKGAAVNRNSTTININEQMGNLIPANAIADLNTGEVVAKLAMSSSDLKRSTPINNYHCKINLNIDKIKKEEKNYIPLPKYYDFGTPEEKNNILLDNFKKINSEIEYIIENEHEL